MQETTCITCSIFDKELLFLQKEGRLPCRLRSLDSLLHLNPELLGKRLRDLVEQERAAGHPVLLLYGDCHPFMADLESLPGVGRMPGLNCCEILLGPAEYRRLIAEGAFLLMPGWAGRWAEIFEKRLGLRGETARAFLRDTLTRILYLDTGLHPVPAGLLREIADYSGLPCAVRKVSLDLLAERLSEELKRIQTDAP